jgi:hypothetical protein
MTAHLMLKKTIIITFTFDLLVLAFFILGEVVSSSALTASLFPDHIEKFKFHHML